MAVSLTTEMQLWDSGARVVAGIDEVGRGALAGPVTVGVVALERCQDWPTGLADSKRLTPHARALMADALATFGVARAVAHASPDEIDHHGIIAALRLAAVRALGALDVAVDAIILDGKHDYLTSTADLFTASSAVPDVPLPPVTMVVGGDNLCASVAAGSVLAKVARDAVMTSAHEQHPHFGWAGNKGYGSADHMAALRQRGPSPLHRRSWNLPDREPTHA